MSLIKCSECKADMSDKASECPKCGCPIEQILLMSKEKKQKKQRMLMLAAIVGAVFIIGAVIIFKLISAPDRSGYFPKTKWGMTVEEVKNVFGEKARIDESGESISVIVEDIAEIENIDGLCSFDFKKNKLVGANIWVEGVKDSSYSELEVVSKLVEYYQELYGDYQDTSDWNHYIWITNKSKIDVNLIVEKIILVEYKDVNQKEELQ